MKIEPKKLLDKIKPVVGFLRRYMVIIFIAVFVGIYGFLVFRINQLSSIEPSEDAVTEKLQGTVRPKIDQSIVDKMQKLQDQNIQVRTLFKQARDNPFNE